MSRLQIDLQHTASRLAAQVKPGVVGASRQRRPERGSKRACRRRCCTSLHIWTDWADRQWANVCVAQSASRDDLRRFVCTKW